VDSLSSLAAIAKRIEQKLEKLPSSIDESVVRECWDEAWRDYLETRRAQGYDDPKRLPPTHFLAKRTEI
jgi:hypothetical protein